MQIYWPNFINYFCSRGELKFHALSKWHFTKFLSACLNVMSPSLINCKEMKWDFLRLMFFVYQLYLNSRTSRSKDIILLTRKCRGNDNGSNKNFIWVSEYLGPRFCQKVTKQNVDQNKIFRKLHYSCMQNWKLSHVVPNSIEINETLQKEINIFFFGCIKVN